jgi:hypothetical protein
MRHLLTAAGLALALSGCGTTETPTETDAGIVVRHEYVTLTGTAQFHPLEVAWRASAGGPGAAPTLEGTEIRVENSTDALLSKPPLAKKTLAADGKFSFGGEEVDTVNVSIALVGSVLDPTGAVFQSGYGLHRYRPGEARPTELRLKPVYVLSKAMVEKLAAATGSRSFEDLETEGFVLGQIVDKDGAPMAGAKLARMELTASGSAPRAVENTEDEHVIDYLNDDLSGLAPSAQTSASGAFLLYPGTSTREYSAIKGETLFEVRLSGARPKTALSLIIAPL